MQSSLIIKILIQIIKQKFFFFFTFFLFFGKIYTKTNKLKTNCLLEYVPYVVPLLISCASMWTQKINKSKNNNYIYYTNQNNQLLLLQLPTNQPYQTKKSNTADAAASLCLLWKTKKPQNQKQTQQMPNAILTKKQSKKTTKNQNKIAKQKSNQPLIGLPWVYARCLQTCRVWMPFCTSAGHCGPTRWWFHYGVHGRRKR